MFGISTASKSRRLSDSFILERQPLFALSHPRINYL
jgi:hypothetical protein